MTTYEYSYSQSTCLKQSKRYKNFRLIYTFRNNSTANDDPRLAKCNYKSWAGNGYCDDPVNNEDCAFDLGDCCPKNPKNDDWKKYCKKCECKQI